MNELSAPFNLGPVKVVPYGVANLTGYSRDLAGQDVGRFYGGGGVRTALTFSRVYNEVSSELFNLKGLNHKATWHANYYTARSNVDHRTLPQLDRLNDDIHDLTYRSITPLQNIYIKDPRDLRALQTAGFYNPQNYAIRRLVDNRVDTRDDMEVVQVGLDQRWQTKRGAPGREHTVDWLAFDVSTSLFPRPDRDNFGKSTAFLEYRGVWNIGDETSLFSSGWFDPFESGARYWNVGWSTSRPKGANFGLSYSKTDPLNTNTLVGNVGYQLSKKYAINFLALYYDFGNDVGVMNMFQVMRTGTDFTMMVGIGYNQIQNNTIVQFAIVPNLAAGFGLARTLSSPVLGITPTR
jgi:hypothetical protein